LEAWIVGLVDYGIDGIAKLQYSKNPLIQRSNTPAEKIVAPPHSQEVRVERLGPFLFLRKAHRAWRKAKIFFIDAALIFYYHGT